MGQPKTYVMTVTEVDGEDEATELAFDEIRIIATETKKHHACLEVQFVRENEAVVNLPVNRVPERGSLQLRCLRGEFGLVESQVLDVNQDPVGCAPAAGPAYPEA